MNKNDVSSAAVHRAWCYASLAPTKDMELVVQGASLGCACFQLLLHTALRALIDRLGVATFNVGIFNVCCSGDRNSSAPDVGATMLAADGTGYSRPPILAR
jgi:hypothetical protein